jgi:thiamine-phosphate pyrophosphorylase
MRSLTSAKLYGILDTGYCRPDHFPAMLQAMLAGGIDIVQLRAKGYAAEQIRPWIAPLSAAASEAGVPFIINDFPELAPLAHGLHLGQEDGPLQTARASLPQTAILGRSTHSLAQAVAAEAEGADYIGFGPLFPTPTKAGRPAIGLEEMAAVHEQVRIPIFCIGGIKRENLPQVITAGARRVVIVSGLLQATDIPSYIADCNRLLTAAGS